MSNMNDSSSPTIDTYQCPICLVRSDDTAFVQTKCGHCFCTGCMQAVLRVRGERSTLTTSPAEHTVWNVPTQGKCPMCRQGISWFEVQPVGTKDGTEDDESPPLWKVQHSLPHAMHGTTVYCRQGRTHYQGLESIHFVQGGNPFIDISQCKRHARFQRKGYDRYSSSRIEGMEDSSDGSAEPHHFQVGETTPDRLEVASNWFFHEPSRTFHGRIDFDDSEKEGQDKHRFFQGCSSWKVILGFSKDYRYISSGAIVKEPKGINIMPSLNSGQESSKFPLDGSWSLVWYDKEQRRQQRSIQVRNHAYELSGWWFYVHVAMRSAMPFVTISWPMSEIVQVSQADGSYFEDQRSLFMPTEGDQVLWTTNHAPDQEAERQTLLWIRLEEEKHGTEPAPLSTVVSFGSHLGQELYQQVVPVGMADSLSLSCIPTYHVNTLWGNVFCKRYTIGRASYHFLSPTDSYLSHEHEASRQALPPLDNGNPLPARIPFSNLIWNEENRRLTAEIDWEAATGCSWNDNVKWKLEMSFDSEYLVILAGRIHCEWCTERRAPPRPVRPPPPRHRPPPVAVYVPPPETEQQPEEATRNEEWIMSGYGHDQLYVNAACLERYKDEQDVNYRLIWDVHRQRLRDESATSRTLDYVEWLFEAAASASGNLNGIIDFNLPE